MNAVIKASVALVILVAVLSLGLAMSGMHKTNLIMSQLIGITLAIVINVACVYWGLKQTAAENGYGKQLLNALMIGVIGGVLVFAFTVLMLSVLMPGYLEEAKQAALDLLESAQLPQAQLDAQMQALEQATPVSQAIPSMIGTLFTSLISGAIIAIFKRRK